jgi:hypothetical protein
MAHSNSARSAREQTLRRNALDEHRMGSRAFPGVHDVVKYESRINDMLGKCAWPQNPF